MSEPLHFGSGSDETPTIVSDGFIEAMWEMLIALGTVVAICIGVISLAAHLNETQKVRGVAENSTRAAGSWAPVTLDHVPRPRVVPTQTTDVASRSTSAYSAGRRRPEERAERGHSL